VKYTREALDIEECYPDVGSLWGKAREDAKNGVCLVKIEG
jgi:hypothetical protein